MVLTGRIPSSTLCAAIPVFSPAYRAAAFPSRFTDIECFVVKYRSDGSRIRSLIPDNLKIEDKPIVCSRLIYYGNSPIGPYHELLQSVEVEFKGNRYEYSILVILDNEDAAYSGRELWGAPKVLGSFDFPSGPDGMSGFLCARVSRPQILPIFDLIFKPTRLLETKKLVGPDVNTLFLRSIPSPMPDKTPHIRQFTEVNFQLEHKQVWEGVASLNFPARSMFDPLHLCSVEEYIYAFHSRGSTATLSPVNVHHL